MRYRYVASLSFAVAALCATARSAEAQCAPGWTFFAGTGNCYTLNFTSQTWQTHQTTAAAAGAHLVTLGSAPENEFVRSTFTGGRANTVWIGFNDLAVENTFVWVTGEPVVFTNWAGGEPNNFGNEDVVQMYSTGFWNDLPSSNSLAAVYELEATTAPEPATLALLAGGLLGVAAVARRRRA